MYDRLIENIDEEHVVELLHELNKKITKVQETERNSEGRNRTGGKPFIHEDENYKETWSPLNRRYDSRREIAVNEKVVKTTKAMRNVEASLQDLKKCDIEIAVWSVLIGINCGPVDSKQAIDHHLWEEQRRT
ncbi:hypothetical protein RUM43_004973 [Polyplax serrata]|uniref:Uncharacterized protein n=1 Tax=Polyplax serrata TaxID=468196 RepID=A0AAN8SBE5_POLSC